MLLLLSRPPGALGGVLTIDVLVELCLLHAPLAASTNLNALQVTALDESPGLGHRDIEGLGHIWKCEEPSHRFCPFQCRLMLLGTIVPLQSQRE